MGTGEAGEHQEDGTEEATGQGRIGKNAEGASDRPRSNGRVPGFTPTIWKSAKPIKNAPFAHRTRMNRYPGTLRPGIRVYIAGPMSGLPEYNYPAFRDAQSRLESLGAVPISPAHPSMLTLPYNDCLQRGIGMMMTCEIIALLPGWENSRGAQAELEVGAPLGILGYPLDVIIRNLQRIA